MTDIKPKKQYEIDDAIITIIAVSNGTVTFDVSYYDWDELITDRYKRDIKDFYKILARGAVE